MGSFKVCYGQFSSIAKLITWRPGKFYVEGHNVSLVSDDLWDHRTVQEFCPQCTEVESKEKYGVWDPVSELTDLSLCPIQSQLRHIYLGLGNPMPESTLSPSQGL
jgi:hypothetical protein